MVQSNVNTVVDGLLGWVVSHPKYGKWFISRNAVIANMQHDYLSAHPDKPAPEPCDESIQTWFNEQISWVEVSALGKQIERPDMNAVELAWRHEMTSNTDLLD